MKKYLWGVKNGDRLNGPFDSKAEAVLDAKKNAKRRGKMVVVDIWDARPATKRDAELFGYDAQDEGIDTTTKKWWRGLVVPENLVGRVAVTSMPYE